MPADLVVDSTARTPAELAIQISRWLATDGIVALPIALISMSQPELARIIFLSGNRTRADCTRF